MSGFSSLTWLLFAWGAVTAAYVILMIYRSLITMREDDQLFLDAAQKSAAAEQLAIQGKLTRLRPYTMGLGYASACLAVGVVGVWIYQAMTRFNTAP